MILNFLGNTKDPPYESTVADLMQHLRILGCNMSIKLHFLNSHVDYFWENLGSINKNKVSVFIKTSKKWKGDIKVNGINLNGINLTCTMADYCWYLKRETEKKKMI